MLIFKILLVDFKLKVCEGVFSEMITSFSLYQENMILPVSCNLLENHKKTILLEDKSNS